MEAGELPHLGNGEESRITAPALNTPRFLPRGERMETFLARRRRDVLLAIVMLACSVRLVYFLEANGGPLVVMHQWTETDMSYYDFWARSILSGDILSRDVQPPLHGWHVLLADEWLRLNPPLEASLKQDATAAGAATGPAQKDYVRRAIWRQWIGPRRFYQEPAYPYLVALTYRVFSPDPRWVFLWQMILGVLGAVLVHRVTERHFGALPAALAGAFAAVATPTLMHELTLLRDPLIAFMGILLVYLTDKAIDRREVVRWLLLGTAVGFAMLTKSIYTLSLLGLLGVLVVAWWRRWKALAVSGAALLAGVAVVLSPVILRNVAVGAPPMALAGNNAGLSFVQNNLYDFAWDRPNPVNGKEFPRIVGETDARLLPGAMAALRTHPGVRSVLWMIACKVDQVWHWWERPDNANIYYYQLHAPILKIPFTYWLAAFPGLLGLALSLRHPRRHLSLYLLVLASVTPLVLVNVMARYRLPLLMALLPFAASAAVLTTQWLRRRQWQGAASLAALIAIGFWTGRSMSAQHGPLVRYGDFGGAFLACYERPLQQALAARDYRRAADTLAEFLRHVPGDIERLGPDREPKEEQEARLAHFLMGVYRDCQSLYLQAREPALAWPFEQRAEELMLSLVHWQNRQPMPVESAH